MKKYYAKNNPKSESIKLIIIFLVFRLIIFLIEPDLSKISTTFWVIWSLFSIFIIYGIITLLKNKPTLIIDKTFMIDNSHVFSCGKVKWDEIKKIEIRKGINSNFLCFDFFDENKILAQKNIIMRFFMKTNKKKLGTICVIPQISVNDNLENVLIEIRKIQKNNEL